MRFDHDDIITYSAEGNLEMLMAAVYCLGITEVVGIRRQMRNPVLYAIERGQIDILKFFVEKLGVNIKLCLRDPSHTEEKR